MSDPEVPAWYRRYVLPSGRFVGYVAGFFLAAFPVSRAVAEATVRYSRFSVPWPWVAGIAVVLAAGLFVARRDVSGARLVQFGLVALIAFVLSRRLLVDGSGFASGSPYLFADLALATVAALVVAYALTFGGVGAELKRAAESPWRDESAPPDENGQNGGDEPADVDAGDDPGV